MLILCQKERQIVRIFTPDGHIDIETLKIDRGRVRYGITADKSKHPIFRHELLVDGKAPTREVAQ